MAIKDFKTALRAACHASILNCYHRYNAKGGCIVPLQSGLQKYFPRACILAIYCDQPAAVKCTLTGSACPVCFTCQPRMSNPTAAGVLMRTDDEMHKSRALIRKYRDRKQIPGAGARALKLAKRNGVQLGALSPWSNRDQAAAASTAWVFGPDPVKDNVYQCMPQVNLHGFDEGLVQKMNFGAVETFVAHVAAAHNMNRTAVCIQPLLSHFCYIFYFKCSKMLQTIHTKNILCISINTMYYPCN